MAGPAPEFLLDISESEIKQLHEYVQTMLGGEDVDVDITEREIKVLARRGLKVYVKEINQWQVRNQFSNIMGFKANTNFTKRFVIDNAMLAQRMSDWWSSMARVGGKIPWKKDFIELEEGRQIYNLANESSQPYEPGSRRIHRVMWFMPPELVGRDFVPDVLFTNLWSFGQAGLTFGGHRLAYLGQLEDIVLLTQAFETRNKILFSEFFYNISGDVLEITPMPGSAVRIPSDAKLFYYYFDEEEFIKQGGQDPENETKELIANPLQVKIDEVPYSDLNSVAKEWVDDFSLALAKYVQASKWRKVRSIASPGSDYQIEFDYQSLLSESQDEKQKMIEDLREELAKMDFVKMYEDKASMARNAAETNKYSPRKLFIG